jgi:chromosome segregation ATPase
MSKERLAEIEAAKAEPSAKARPSVVNSNHVLIEKKTLDMIVRRLETLDDGETDDFNVEVSWRKFMDETIKDFRHQIRDLSGLMGLQPSYESRFKQIVEKMVSGELMTESLQEDLTEEIEKREELQTEVTTLKGEVADLKGEVADLKGEVADLKGEVARYGDWSTQMIRYTDSLVERLEKLEAQKK